MRRKQRGSLYSRKAFTATCRPRRMKGAARPGSQESERGRVLRIAASGMKTSRSSNSLAFESRLSKLKRASSDDHLSKPRSTSAATTSRLKKTITTGAVSEVTDSRLKSSTGTVSTSRRSGIPGPREAPAASARERVSLHGQANTKRALVSSVPTRQQRSPVKPQPGHGASPESQNKKLHPEARSKDPEISRVSRELQGSPDANKVTARTLGFLRRELPLLKQDHRLSAEKLQATAEVGHSSSSTDSSLLTSESGNTLRTSGSSSSDLTKTSMSPDVPDLDQRADRSSGLLGGGSAVERLHDGTTEEMQTPPQQLSSKEQVLHEFVVERVQRNCMKRLSHENQELEGRLHKEAVGMRGQEKELQEGLGARCWPVELEQKHRELERLHAELQKKVLAEQEQLLDLQQQLSCSLRHAEEAQGTIRGLQEEVAQLHRLLEAEKQHNGTLAKILEDLKVENSHLRIQLESTAVDHSPGAQLERTCTGLQKELSEAHGELKNLQGLLCKREEECQQLTELCDRQGEQLININCQLQEKASKNQAEVRDMKDLIYELEDQVEQDRVVKLHNNQVISDLEGKVMKLEEQKLDLERQLKALTKQMKKEMEEWRIFQADLQTAVVVANDIKSEAQQELRTVKQKLREEEERSSRLQEELEAVRTNSLLNRKGPSDDGDNNSQQQRVFLSRIQPAEPGQPLTDVKSLIKSFDMGCQGGIGQNVAVHPVSHNPLSGIPVRTAPAAAVSPMQRHSICGSGKTTNKGSGNQARLRETCHTDVLKRRAEELKPDYFLPKTPSLESLGKSLALSFGAKMSALASSSFSPQSKLSVERKDPLAALAREYGGSKRNGLLKWCQRKTEGYPDIDITNFSSSWSDGLALCALLHTYLPAHIPYQELSSQNKKRNFLLAFQAAESIGIKPSLELSEMMYTERPDWQRVMQYVAQIYKYFET
uniref:Cytospin-B isoform X2 n=1 Tax=Geotrypetes seraphini TaxID=260995 RepID=A0A6P8PRX7_GEOSA|nr:cytospin-B isoform X2 [Geotrypetes seraphini]